MILVGPDIAVVPRPRQVVMGGGSYVLPATPTIVTERGPAAEAEQFVRDVAADCGVRFGLGGPNADVRVRLVPDYGLPDREVVGLSPSGGAPTDERYRLVIDGRGIEVTAVAPVGAHRGLSAVRQIIATADVVDGGRALPTLVIDDAPLLAWRGLSLDVVRTWYPTEVLERVVDVLSAYRMNVLHLHLTDDQGWRLPVPAHPELAAVGGATAHAGRTGHAYTAAELGRLGAYAAARHVVIVPEADMPGHCGAALASLPALARPQEGEWPPRNMLYLDHAGVPEFVDEVVAALAAVATGPYVHIGGDEAFGMADADYVPFVDRARAAVRAIGLRPVGWQESARGALAAGDVVQHWLAFGGGLDALAAGGALPPALAEQLGMPPEVLAAIAEMVRRGAADLARAVECGAHVVLSPVSHLYLDRPYADTSDDPVEADRRERLGLMVYPRMTVEESFAFEALSLADVPREQVAGLEAAMWCETVADADELLFMLLPRLVGVAERAWGEGTAWPDHRDRLREHLPVWAARGWTAFTAPLR
jgi:hexosaminidase